MEIIFIIGGVLAAIVVLGILLTTCYVKAVPTEAVIVTGLGHKEPKFVTGRGVLVLPFIQRYDKLIMKVLKLDVKTPPTGVKTAEGVPLWIDKQWLHACGFSRGLSQRYPPFREGIFYIININL